MNKYQLFQDTADLSTPLQDFQEQDIDVYYEKFSRFNFLSNCIIFYITLCKQSFFISKHSYFILFSTISACIMIMKVE